MASREPYLAVVLDAFSRKVGRLGAGESSHRALALGALDMALREREIGPGELIHHTDRGVQYACGDYIARLEAAGIQPRMSRPGCPYDNAVAESFMKTLKAEEAIATAYKDIHYARSAIGEFIENVYNRHRLHSALNYRSPMEFELASLTADTAAVGANLQP